jgi:RpiB/LacA/LacB family sugar-phosphate isomerase
MAEGLFKHAVRGRGSYRVVSAGVGAVDGQPASDHAVRALREIGIDINGHRSRHLTADLVSQADYIFGMTHSHVDAIMLLYPQAAEKTFLLREFDETLDAYENDISDPIGGSYEVYRNCRDQIEQGIAAMLKFVEQTSAAPGTTSQTAARQTVALGADHGGFDLKLAVRHHLQSKGWIVVDYGAASKESTDYPDFAHLVGYAVADNKNEFGILICTSGVGMSITANKIPGVRAALVFDDEMAGLARQHNDANVLCIGARQTEPEMAKKMVDAFLSA